MIFFEYFGIKKVKNVALVAFFKNDYPFIPQNKPDYDKEYTKYYITNNHIPIVSKDLWEGVIKDEKNLRLNVLDFLCIIRLIGGIFS